MGIVTDLDVRRLMQAILSGTDVPVSENLFKVLCTVAAADASVSLEQSEIQELRGLQ